MTIYIATDGEYSDFHICAVFTDQKQAEFYCALHECGLEEWESETQKMDTEKTPKQLWRATFRSDGELFALYPDYLTFREINNIEKRFGSIYVSVSLDANVPEEKVKKIIFDKVAKWRYEQLLERG